MRSFLRTLREGALRKGAFSLFLVLLSGLPACAGSTTAPVPARPEAGVGTALPETPLPAPAAAIAPEWEPLRKALAADGLSGPRVDALLAELGPRTQAPMGRKMVELYKRKFLSKPSTKKPARDAVYKGFVTEANARRCAQFIADNRAAFDRARRKYDVPPSVASALLFVETGLGRHLGDVKDNALKTLASMSQSRTLASIPDWYGKMPGYARHEDWFAEIMPKRADWAYRETRALVRYMLDNNLSADRLPGSFYGAIGLCQFMPSNIAPYGEDGNGDGVIDLYTVDDAVMSLSRYLARYGWKASAPREARHKVLMRYNKSNMYANTILALGRLVDQQLAQGTKKGGKSARSAG